MRKAWLIARHEFIATISRPSFRVFAAIFPVLAILGLTGVALFQSFGDDGPPEQIRAGFVDSTTGPDGEPLLQAFYQQDNVLFVPYDDPGTATAALNAGEIALLYLVPESYLETGLIVEIKQETAGFDTAGQGVNPSATPLGKFLLNNLFVGDVGLDRARRVLVPYQIVTTEVDETGAPVEDGLDPGRLIFFIGVGVLLLVSVFTTSGYLLQGLNEEKESRIMEVLLSSVRPEQLMLGKLVGLGASGLLVMAIWSATGVGFLLVIRTLVDIPADVSLTPSPVGLVIAFTYYLLGYALFGTMMAALGAVTTSQREAGQVTFIIVLPAMAPMWFIETIVEHPDGGFARILSLIPFTAPVVSLARLGVDGMSIVDLAASTAVLAASVAVVVLLTLRLFRAYLLLYGQRPGIRQMLRTLRGSSS